MVTDGAGNPTSTNEFYPYGQGPQATSQNHYLFSGKERDQESGGLDYFGARYYLSGIGRFMSADWSAQADPVPYAKLADPQTLNLYAYVRNNPLNTVDTDGHGEVVSGFYWTWLHGNLSEMGTRGINEVIKQISNAQECDKAHRDAQQHISARDKAYLDKYYKPVAAKAKEYGVDPALVLGLGGESGFADTSIKNNMYNWTGDAFGMTGGSTANPATATSPEDNVNQLFANWGGQMRGAGSDVMKFLHGLEQQDANGNQLTGPPDKNGNRSNLGHIFNSVQMPPTVWMNKAQGWIRQMQRDIPIYLSQP